MARGEGRPDTKYYCSDRVGQPQVYNHRTRPIKLSREESAEHWLYVGLKTDDEDAVKDIRPQLLAHEPMVLTPP